MQVRSRPSAALVALCAVVLAVIGPTGTATAAEGDVAPPQVTALVVGPGEVGADGVLRIAGRVAASDDGGLERVVLTLLRPTGRTDADRHVGETSVVPEWPGRATLDERFALSLPNPRTASLVLRITAFDVAGRVTRLDAAALEAAGLPAVVDVVGGSTPGSAVPPTTPTPAPVAPADVPDTSAPRLQALHVDEPDRRVDPAGRDVVWVRGRVAAVDDGDGIDRVVVAVVGADGIGLGTGTALPTRVGATTMDSAFALAVTSGSRRDSAPARGFLRVTTYDVHGNVATLGAEDLAARGWPTVVDLREPVADVVVPPAPPVEDPPRTGDDATVAPTGGIAVARRAGADRDATAAALAGVAWPEGTREVVVATGRDFPDALAAAPFAARRDAALLLHSGGDVTALVARVAALGADVVHVVGGRSAVADEVVDALRAAGRDVERRRGADRHATAADLAHAWSQSNVVWLASGAASPDALAAGAAAARRGEPLLLVGSDALPEVTTAALRRLAPSHVLLVGGTSAVSTRVEDAVSRIAPVRRVSGRDRWATAVAVARTGWSDDVRTPLSRGIGADRAMLAAGHGFADAVAGAPLAALGHGPLLLTERTSLPRATRTALEEATSVDGLRAVTVLGGPAAVADAVLVTTRGIA